MSDESTEADYMYSCELAALGGKMEHDDPEFEVVNHKNDILFCGSRAACWDFKRRRGGYVRPFSGFDDLGDYE
jgi:hypothetical protein